MSASGSEYDLTFEEFEKRHGIKLAYPSKYDIQPEESVSVFNDFPLMTGKEREIVEAYSSGKKRKSVRVSFYYYLYIFGKKIGIV